MTRFIVTTIWLAAAFAACNQGEDCKEGEELQDDGTCAPVDTTDSEDTDTVTDTDTGEEVEVGAAVITLKWTIDRLPHDNSLRLECDGREVFFTDDMPGKKDYEETFEVSSGSECVVTAADARGGYIPRGALLNCSTSVAEWESERTLEAIEVARVQVFGCVEGCNDPVANNYDPRANLDDGSCQYVLGCTDPTAPNYDPAATKDDNSCDYGGSGLIEVDVITDSYPSDTFAVIRCEGYDVTRKDNFLAANSVVTISAIVDAGFDCEVLIGDKIGDVGAGAVVRACGAEIASIEKATGDVDGGELSNYEQQVVAFRMSACSGCTNPFATNFDAGALVDDGTCLTQ